MASCTSSPWPSASWRFDDADRVLLVGQHRDAVNAFSWDNPEGGVPAGECPLEGPGRELREETVMEAAELAGARRVALSNSVTDQSAILFVATDLTAAWPMPDGTEASETALEAAFDQALA